eukprot:sb/3472254/
MRRQSIINRFRDIAIDEDSVKELLHAEFLALRRRLGFREDEFETDDEIEQILGEIQQEILFELGEIDSGARYFEQAAMDHVTTSVICPICQKNNLIVRPDRISCGGCEMVVDNTSRFSADQISGTLTLATDLHSNNCGCLPMFLIEDDDELNSLMTMQCNFCRFFYRII